MPQPCVKTFLPSNAKMGMTHHHSCHLWLRIADEGREVWECLTAFRKVLSNDSNWGNYKQQLETKTDVCADKFGVSRAAKRKPRRQKVRTSGIYLSCIIHVAPHKFVTRNELQKH